MTISTSSPTQVSDAQQLIERRDIDDRSRLPAQDSTVVKEPMNTRSPFTFDVWLGNADSRENVSECRVGVEGIARAYRNMNRLPWFATYCPVPTR
jgi:hypothetical protein